MAARLYRFALHALHARADTDTYTHCCSFVRRTNIFLTTPGNLSGARRLEEKEREKRRRKKKKRKEKEEEDRIAPVQPAAASDKISLRPRKDFYLFSGLPSNELYISFMFLKAAKTSRRSMQKSLNVEFFDIKRISVFMLARCSMLPGAREAVGVVSAE